MDVSLSNFWLNLRKKPLTECEHFLSCEKCMKDIECGWCAEKGKCIKGDAIGQKEGQCKRGWKYQSCV